MSKHSENKTHPVDCLSDEMLSRHLELMGNQHGIIYTTPQMTNLIAGARAKALREFKYFDPVGFASWLFSVKVKPGAGPKKGKYYLPERSEFYELTELLSLYKQYLTKI